MTAPIIPAIDAVQSVQGAKSPAAAAADAMPAAPDKAADPASAHEFAGHVAGADAGQAGTVQMHRAHEPHALEAAIAHMRADTATLDARYEQAMTQASHASSLIDPSDPMMSMVRLADFSYSTSLTLAQYQFSMSMADASNGLSRSLLKNNTE